MRIKEGFTLRRVGGQATVMARGAAAARFGHVAELTAQWQQVGVVE